jgi:transcriptional regulator with XRE-family HTH domain
MERIELGPCLRAWRERLSPAEVGLPAGSRRRTPGLRRHEVAALAGLSVEYLARLEQGRATHPSASVLAPLARALRVTEAERDLLFRLAGHVPPATGAAPVHVTPSVQRIIDRLGDTPVHVIDVAWNVVLANPLGAALLGPLATGDDRNILRQHFLGAPSYVVYTPAERAAFEAGAASDLRLALTRFPEDAQLTALIEELREASPRFRELWEGAELAPRRGGRKTIDHPSVGRIHLDCDVLASVGSALRLVVYTAPLGSPDAGALALLSAIGTQSFAGDVNARP